MRAKDMLPAQAAAIALYVEQHGLRFNESDDFESFEYYDIEDVSLTRGAILEMFNTTASSRGSHSRGISGCNLPDNGVIGNNESLVVTLLALEPLEVVTAAKIVDVVRFTRYGVSDGFFVEDNPKLHEHRLANRVLREPLKVLTAGEGTGAAVINAVMGEAAPKELALDSAIVIPPGGHISWKLHHFGTADLSAALSVRAVMAGLRVRHQPLRSAA